MIYIDNAATTFPKPDKVYYEVEKHMKNYGANPGRGSYNIAIKASNNVLGTRKKVAKLFNISNPLQVAFTSNATEAINIGIKGILKKGDHVISTVIEHNSVLRPLNSLSKQGIKVTLVASNNIGYIDVKNIKKEIRKNTKLIVMSHASNVLGTIQDINKVGEIAKAKNIKLMVDSAQTSGIIPIDVQKSNVDILAFSGHKGLFGPQGIGGIFVKENMKLRNFKEGGTGSKSNSMDQPNFMPDKFESGTLNIPGIVGLGAGIDFINKEGIENIREHEKNLTKYLIEELNKLSYIKFYGKKDLENRIGVVSINVDNIDCSKVGYLLNKNNIAVRTGYHCSPLIHGIINTCKTGTVRLSPGYFNTFKDIEKVLECIKNIYNNKL